MSWMPLSQRLDRLPLILAGPMLRQTQTEAITVWVALKQSRNVTLRVYATSDEGSTIGKVLFEGSRPTLQLGKHLHLVAVTATSIGREQLVSGQVYAYNLFFDSETEDLHIALDSGDRPSDYIRPTISYFTTHQLPTFALPPDDLNNLRLLHGSCRKAHGGDRDALVILDDLIARHAHAPHLRPHQLFLTGDQIYGDDVADALLLMAIDTGNTLLGWEEHLPLENPQTGKLDYLKASELKPGQRCDTARVQGGLTAMLIDKEHLAKSHLFSFGEYVAMYLFAWSPVLWPEVFPDSQTLYPGDAKIAKRWQKEVRDLKSFSRDLRKVQRAFANIPVYTIFDDHDVTDDWFLNRWWCTSVLTKPLGQRVVFNGMLAYALFQAWGNLPEQFVPGQAGGQLLEAVSEWSKSAGTDRTAESIAIRMLGLPSQDLGSNSPLFKLDRDVLILDRDPQALTWHYTIRSPKHEVILLDTRTWRGYPKEADTELNPPMLLSPTAFEQQIVQPLETTDRLINSGEAEIELTLLVLPTNLVSLTLIDTVQHSDLSQGKVFHSDVGDSWNFHAEAFTKLLSEVFQRRERVVILSGDIHYACAVRLSYWFKRHYATPKIANVPEGARVLAQLTSSAIDNVEWKAQLAHTKVKSLAPETTQDWLGWNDPPDLVEIQVTPERVRQIPLEMSGSSPFIRQLQGMCGNSEIAWQIAIKDSDSFPDWRYRIDWMKRQKARLVADEKSQVLLTPYTRRSQWLDAVRDRVSLLWRNQWLQEGEEVVAYNNISLVSFRWSSEDKNVIQDTYWRPPWEPTSIVYSRYWVSLQLDAPPPLPRAIASVKPANQSPLTHFHESEH